MLKICSRPPPALYPLLLAYILLLPLPLSLGAEEAAEPFTIEFGEGKVTLRAEAAPLGSILEELSRRAGFELFLYVPAEEAVTADFSGLPLDEALARLLPSYGFLFRRSREGKLDLRAVAVVPSGAGREDGRSGFSFRRIARLDYGSGPGQAGLISAPGVERQGPQSFAVGPGGEILLADTVNRRVQIFASDGKFEREIALPLCPRDIAVSEGGEIFVLDDPGRTVFRLGPDGERRSEIRLPPDLAGRLETIRWGGGLLLRTRDGDERQLSGPGFEVPATPGGERTSDRGSRLPSGDFCRVRKLSADAAEVTISGRDGEARDVIPLSIERLASVAFLGAAPSGDIFLQVERVRSSGVGVDLEVLVINPAGILIDRVEAIPNNYANWTSRLLQVDSRGDVYQALPAPEGMELNRWSRQIKEEIRE